MDLVTAHTEVMDHAIRAVTTTRIHSRLEATGIVVSRYGLVTVLLLIGVLKFTPEGSRRHSAVGCAQPANVLDVWPAERTRGFQPHRCH